MLNAKISSIRYQIVLVIDHKDVHICNCNAETKRNRIKEKIISIDKRNQHNYLPKKMALYNTLKFSLQCIDLRMKLQDLWFQLS